MTVLKRLKKIAQKRKRKTYKACEKSIKEFLSEKKETEVKKNEEI